MRKNFAEPSGHLIEGDLQIYVSLQQNTNSHNTHTFKIIVSTPTEPTFYRDNKIHVFTTRDNRLRYLKTHTFPKARDQITNQHFICLLTPRGVPANVKYRGYTHDTKHSFYSAHFLVIYFFFYLFIWLKYSIVIAWVGPYTSECTDHVRHCWTAHCSNTPALGLSGLFVCFLTLHKVFK